MKKLKLLLLLPMMLLSGCNAGKEEITKYKNIDEGFAVICEHKQGGYIFTFIRDTYTDNMYVSERSSGSYGQTFGPYYDKDGNIMKYSDFIKMHNH